MCGNVGNNNFLHILETHLVAFVSEFFFYRDPEKHRVVSKELEFKLKEIF